MGEIESGIPIPPPRSGGRPQKWPIHKLGIGQSIACASLNEAHSVRHQIRKLGGRAQLRRVQSDMWRVWRVE